MAHEIGKKWHSRVGGNDDKDIDLTQLTPDGLDMSLCNHDGKKISGSVERIDVPEVPGGRCYVVRIDEELNTSSKIVYRGVAIWNPANQVFNKIVGVKRKVFLTFSPQAAREKEEADLAAQEEGTWTGTQP